MNVQINLTVESRDGTSMLESDVEDAIRRKLNGLGLDYYDGSLGRWVEVVIGGVDQVSAAKTWWRDE